MSLPGMNPNLPQSQQATRHARRVYVGGLPPTANEQSIATFFSHALAAIGGNTAGPGALKWGGGDESPRVEWRMTPILSEDRFLGGGGQGLARVEGRLGVWLWAAPTLYVGPFTVDLFVTDM